MFDFFAACNASVGELCVDSLPKNDASPDMLQRILSLALTIIGSVALLIVALAGFKYVTSRGDPQAVAKAKNAIIYALIGLIVTILAQVIVVFVINKV